MKNLICKIGLSITIAPFLLGCQPLNEKCKTFESEIQQLEESMYSSSLVCSPDHEPKNYDQTKRKIKSISKMHMAYCKQFN